MSKTGWEATADVEVVFTDDARDLLEGIPVPEFRWLKLSTDPTADLATTDLAQLVFSEKALTVVGPYLADTDVEPLSS